MQKVVNSKFLQFLPFVFLLGPLFLEIYFFLLFLLNIKNLSLKLIEINYFKIILILFFTSVLFSSIFSDHEISFLKGLSYLRFLIYLFQKINYLIMAENKTNSLLRLKFRYYILMLLGDGNDSDQHLMAIYLAKF